MLPYIIAAGIGGAVAYVLKEVLDEDEVCISSSSVKTKKSKKEKKLKKFKKLAKDRVIFVENKVLLKSSELLKKLAKNNYELILDKNILKDLKKSFEAIEKNELFNENLIIQNLDFKKRLTELEELMNSFEENGVKFIENFQDELSSYINQNKPFIYFGFDKNDLQNFKKKYNIAKFENVFLIHNKILQDF